MASLGSNGYAIDLVGADLRQLEYLLNRFSGKAHNHLSPNQAFLVDGSHDFSVFQHGSTADDMVANTENSHFFLRNVVNGNSNLQWLLPLSSLFQVHLTSS